MSCTTHAQKLYSYISIQSLKNFTLFTKGIVMRLKLWTWLQQGNGSSHVESSQVFSSGIISTFKYTLSYFNVKYSHISNGEFRFHLRERSLERIPSPPAEPHNLVHFPNTPLFWLIFYHIKTLFQICSTTRVQGFTCGFFFVLKFDLLYNALVCILGINFLFADMNLLSLCRFEVIFFIFNHVYVHGIIVQSCGSSNGDKGA